MNPYPTKRTADGKSKRRRKRRSSNTSIEVKEEHVVKEESGQNVGMVDVTLPHWQPPSTEAIDTFKSEAETDCEMYFKYDDDCVKKEAKSEDECSKKGCDLAQEKSAGDDQQDEPIHRKRSNAEPSSSRNSIQRKCKAKEKKSR